MITKRKRARRVERKRAMCLTLSDDEMDTFDAMADQKGTTKVALIRQWIRDAAQNRPAPMPSNEELITEIRKAWGNKIKQKERQ